jgi:hypothetical protein
LWQTGNSEPFRRRPRAATARAVPVRVEVVKTFLCEKERKTRDNNAPSILARENLLGEERINAIGERDDGLGWRRRRDREGKGLKRRKSRRSLLASQAFHAVTLLTYGRKRSVSTTFFSL